MHIDLSVMPQGETYEDRYRGYLDVFERIALTPVPEIVHVSSPPMSWLPLLMYLQCHWSTPQFFFKHCEMVHSAMQAYRVYDRTAVEVLCGFRPECVDALWKCDMQWKTKRAIQWEPPDHFVVTNNGSFHRPEVLEFMRKLDVYEPPSRNVVLVPCAADKPYPAPMHEVVLAMLPHDYYVANVTGVLGLIPQELWPSMPHYDSGIPNRWRVFETIRTYFTKWQHFSVIVYCDFYNEAIYHGLRSLKYRPRTKFVLPVKFYPDYVDLMKNEHVVNLRRALENEAYDFDGLD